VKSLALYYFLSYLAMSAFLPFMSIYFSEKGFSGTAVGLILSLWAFVSVIAQPIMGMVNDRMSDSRKILLVSTIVAPILSLGFCYLGSFSAIMALSVVFAWFQSAAGPISDSLAIDIGKREGFSFGSIRLWGALSYSLGTFSIGFLYVRIGYDNSFVIYLAISIAVFLTIFLLPKIKPSPHKVSIFDQANEVLHNKPFVLFLGICLLVSLCSSVHFTFLPIYFKEMGFDKKWLGIAFAIAAIVEVPMFYISAKLGKRLGRFNVLWMASVLTAIRFILIFTFHNVYLVLALQVIDGISFAFFASLAVEVVEGYASERTKATFQTIFAAGTYGLGSIIGSSVGGIIIDHKGAPFLYLVLFFVSTTAALLFILSKHALQKAVDTSAAVHIRQGSKLSN
jgi:PPP family 3-phenylpropionic acid transporter